MVEAHDVALGGLEQRMEDQDEEKRISARIDLTNRRWAKAVVGLAGVAAGATSATVHERAWKWLAALFK